MHDNDALDRITDLEVLVSHQGKMIDELSEALARSWKDVEALNDRLGILTERLLALSEAIDNAPADQKPPHW